MLLSNCKNSTCYSITKTALFLFVLLSSVGASAQNFYAYTDTFGYLYTYNEGYIRKMGEQPVAKYNFGTERVAFVNNLDEFKISIGTGSQVLSEVVPTRWEFSRSMLTFEQSRTLYAYWNMRPKKLSVFNGQYSTHDSIVCFYDRANAFKIFYNGIVYNINPIPVRDYRATRNIAAYNTNAYIFKVFLRGRVRTLEKYEVQDYQVGLNTVGYLDQTGRLKAYNSGKVYDLEEVTPNFYKVADDIILFHTLNDDFKVFYKDSVYQLETFLPAQYWVDNGLVYYADENNRLKVFDRGVLRFASFFMPTNIKVFDNTLCFTDQYNHLFRYQNGEVKNISNEAISKYIINGDLIIYHAQVNDIVFVPKGEKPYRVRYNWQRF